MNFNQAFGKTKDYVNEIVDNKSKPTPIAMVAPELKQNGDIKMEIKKTCAVLGCEDSKSLGPDSFFGFPEDPTLRQVWTDLTGRNNWTPTDYSYICIQHFAVDCFECNTYNDVVLIDKAVPSMKLPKHVLEVEYIDEDSSENEQEEHLEDFESDEEMPAVPGQRLSPQFFPSTQSNPPAATQEPAPEETDKEDLLKLYTEVQKMQRQAVGLRDKLKTSMRVHHRQKRILKKLKETIEMKQNLLNQRRKKRAKILLSIQDKIKEDTNGLVLAMPNRHTEDLKNFALSIYKYSPQAYIYVRNTLRTLLPSTDVLDAWLHSGYVARNSFPVLTNGNLIKVVSEQTENELSCKITLG